MIDAVVKRFGRIDVLINNAGVIQVGPASDMALEDFQEAMSIMFWGPLYTTEETLKHFRRQGHGQIVNIASIGGKVSVPHLLPYCCAKFALVGLSEGLHAELAADNIHVMTVAPGLVRTGSHLNAQFRGRRRREFGWFGLSGNTPILSMAAEDAAAQIVEGLRRRKSDLTLSPQARWFSRAHGLGPGAVADALSLANRLLPDGTGDRHEKLTGRAILDRHKGIDQKLIARAGRRPVALYQ
jgi:short-subunit dehydrogenase